MRLFFGKEDGGIVRSRCRLLVETFVVLNILYTYTFVILCVMLIACPWERVSVPHVDLRLQTPEIWWTRNSADVRYVRDSCVGLLE